MDVKEGVYREPTRLQKIRQKVFGEKKVSVEAEPRGVEAEKPPALENISVDEAYVKSEADLAVEKFFEKYPKAQEIVSPELEREAVDRRKTIDEDVLKSAREVLERVKEANGSMGMLECISLAKLCKNAGVDLQEIDASIGYEENKKNLCKSKLISSGKVEMSESEALRMQLEYMSELLSKKDEEIAELKAQATNAQAVKVEGEPKEAKESSESIPSVTVNIERGEKLETETFRLLPYSELLNGALALHFGKEKIVVVKNDGSLVVSPKIVGLNRRKLTDLFEEMKTWTLEGRVQFPSSPDRMTDRTYSKMNVMLHTFIGHGNLSKNDVAKLTALTPEQIKAIIADEKLRMKVEKEPPNSDRLDYMFDGDELEQIYLQYYAHRLRVEYNGSKVQITTSVKEPSSIQLLKELFENKAYSMGLKANSYQSNYGGLTYTYDAQLVLDSSYSFFANKTNHIPSDLVGEKFCSALCGLVDAKGRVRGMIDSNGEFRSDVTIWHKSSFFLEEVTIGLRDQLGVEAEVDRSGLSNRLIVKGENVRKLCEKLKYLRNPEYKEWRDLILKIKDEGLGYGEVLTLQDKYREVHQEFTNRVKEELEGGAKEVSNSVSDVSGEPKEKKAKVSDTCPRCNSKSEWHLVFGFGEKIGSKPTESGWHCEKCGYYQRETSFNGATPKNVTKPTVTEPTVTKPKNVTDISEPKKLDNEVEEEQPKEVVEGEIPTHIEQKRNEFVKRYGLELANEIIERYKSFAEKYGKELADCLFQDKVKMEKVAELYGSKIWKHYSFPILENSLINRIRLAQAIDDEGWISFSPKKDDGGKYRSLVPEVGYGNTVKELAERASFWMSRRLPKSKTDERKLPIFNVTRTATPGIDLVYLTRPFLTIKHKIEKAEEIIELCKARATIRCDEDGNPIPLPEPKYKMGYRIYKELVASGRTDGIYEEIAQRLECSLKNAYALVWRGKNSESYLQQQRHYQQKMRTRTQR